MTLELTSSLELLAKKIADASADGSTSPVELQSIRDDADRKFAGLPTVSAYRASMRLPAGADAFQKAADAAVEAMQQMALGARGAKLSADERQALKDAVEFQVAYIVAGYKSSIERL